MSAKTNDTSADPASAARASIAHVNREEPGPLRLLIGDDAPEQVATALARRRYDYKKNAKFSWPS